MSTDVPYVLLVDSAPTATWKHIVTLFPFHREARSKEQPSHSQIMDKLPTNLNFISYLNGLKLTCTPCSY